LSEPDVKKMFAALIREEIKKTKKYRKIEGMSARIALIIRRKYRKDIALIRQKVFEKLPISKTTERLITDTVVHLVTGDRLRERGQVSGIVVSGFGEKEQRYNRKLWMDR